MCRGWERRGWFFDGTPVKREPARDVVGVDPGLWEADV